METIQAWPLVSNSGNAFQQKPSECISMVQTPPNKYGAKYSYCRCLMHAILINKGLRQLYAIGRGTHSGILYSADLCPWTSLSLCFVIVSKRGHSVWIVAPWDNGSFLSMPLKSEWLGCRPQYNNFTPNLTSLTLWSGGVETNQLFCLDRVKTAVTRSLLDCEPFNLSPLDSAVQYPAFFLISLFLIFPFLT